MNAEELVFEPDYTLGERYAPLFYAIGAALALGVAAFASAPDDRALGLVAAPPLVLVIAIHTFSYPRRIRFGSEAFHLERRLWPDRRIRYADIVDIGRDRLVTTRGDLKLTRYRNRAALDEIVGRLVDRGSLDPAGLAGRAAVVDAWRRSGLIGGAFAHLAALVLGVLLAVVGFRPSGMNPVVSVVLVGGAGFALGYVVCRYLVLVRVSSEEGPP